MTIQPDTPPGESAESLSFPQAPVHRDGGILIEPALIEEKRWQPLPPKKDRLKNLVYPVDEETGLPYLLRIYDCPSVELNGSTENYDHSWFNRRAPELMGPDGRAVRISMGQWLPVAIHLRKNKIFGSMSRLPQTADDRFLAIVRSLSGIVPDLVMDLSRTSQSDNVSDWLVRVDSQEMAFLTGPSRFYRESCLRLRSSDYRRNEIGRFFVRYAISKGVRDLISDKVIEQFLEVYDIEKNGDDTGAGRRKELGNLMIKKALINVAEAGIASRSQLTSGSMLELLRKFVDRHMVAQFHPMLAEQLAA